MVIKKLAKKAVKKIAGRSTRKAVSKRKEKLMRERRKAASEIDTRLRKQEQGYELAAAKARPAVIPHWTSAAERLRKRKIDFNKQVDTPLDMLKGTQRERTTKKLFEKRKLDQFQRGIPMRTKDDFYLEPKSIRQVRKEKYPTGSPYNIQGGRKVGTLQWNVIPVIRNEQALRKARTMKAGTAVGIGSAAALTGYYFGLGGRTRKEGGRR